MSRRTDKDRDLVWHGLLASAEDDAANALHERRGWLHRHFWRYSVEALGYCTACMPIALAVVEAVRGPDHQIRSAANALRNKL